MPAEEHRTTRTRKEPILGQRGLCVWLTGLSGSGKSTLARAFEHELERRDVHCAVLDGDLLRTGLNHGLGFSEADRTENVRRAAEVARLLVQHGTVAIAALITPTRAMRDHARAIVGEADFVEVFVDAPLDECERRDVKGLYHRARHEQVRHFTGITAPYEAPDRPEVHLRTAEHDIAACLQQLLAFTLPRIQRDPSCTPTA